MSSDKLGPNKRDHVSMCVKRALNFEGRHTNSLIYLCSFFIAQEDFFYQYNQTFQSKLYKVLFRFSQQYQSNISQRQLTVEIAQVLINWSARKMQELSQNPVNSVQEVEDQKNSYMSFNSSVLYQLIRSSIMLQSQNNEPPLKDLLEVSTQCIKLIKKIIIMHTNLRIQFPLFNRLLQNDNDDRENISLIRMILLNVSYILIKYQHESLEFKRFFMEFICNIKQRHYKCILFSIKIISMIVMYNNENEFHRFIRDKIINFMNNDLQTCLEQNVETIQGQIQRLEDGCNSQQKPPIFSYQDQAKCIYFAIPHFTIRLLTNIDSIMDEQRKAGNNQGHKLDINDYKFYKDLANALYRIVITFRKNIVFDQSEFALKIRNRFQVQFMVTNSQTVYTQPDLVTLNEDIVELKVEEPNYDLFNKESVMMGIKLIVRRMKYMEQREAIHILELVDYMLVVLFRYNTNEYIIEQLRQIVDILINDKEKEKSKLLLIQKSNFVSKMLLKVIEFSSEGRKETQSTSILVDKIFEQCLDFLERQDSLQSEYLSKLFDKVFLATKGKSAHLKQRLFKIFEKFNGSSIFNKLKYFFSKHLIEDQDKQVFFQSQSQLLEFTLFNFKEDGPLQKIKYSSRLFPLYNVNIHFDRSLVLSEERTDMQVDEGNQPKNELKVLENSLTIFASKIKKYSKYSLRDLMDPLSEIININPSHSTDKLLTDKLFIKLFWQYWNILSRDEQQFMSETINKFFIKSIPVLQGQDSIKKQSLTKTLLEAVAAVSPQIRIDPEVLQLIAKQMNLWHVSIPILENHIVLYPQNDRYFFALNELYQRLSEEDYIAGLRRSVTECKETRSMISYGQHHKWEEINQQFAYYIDFYAEQEGLYAQMDRDQNIVGKYSCQISRDFIYRHQNLHRKQLEHQKEVQELTRQGMSEQQAQQQAQQNITKNFKDQPYINPFDTPEYHRMIREESFPKDGANRNVKELDLRIWETLFIDSVKILNRWDQYRDIAHTIQNQEMLIEFYWNTKNWQSLSYYENILKKSENIQYQLYYIYLIIQQKKIAQFDDVFKQVIQLAYKDWDQYLPSYVDNIQFDNLILFQLVMESSEGGRNMIKEAQNLRNRGKLGDIKTAINIWRERVPHLCERISMWKEILENRNFIYEQISEIILQQPLPPNQNFTEEQQQQMTKKKQFVNELLDKTWNYAKLASVSRKQGLPSLCHQYLQQAKQQYEGISSPDTLKYERFKCDYELLKLHTQFNNTNPNLPRIIEESKSFLDDQKGYEPWQKAEFNRLFGEYYLQQGNLKLSQSFLKTSLELNKKEAKTWFSYGKLNETVFNELKDERALINAIKGYMSSTTLSLHKSRLIIPYILRLLRRRDIQIGHSGQPQQNAQGISTTGISKIYQNLEQMPAWIWIFWVPQLLNFLFSGNQCAEYHLAKVILYRLSKLYPQSTFYPTKSKQSFSNQKDEAFRDPINITVELIKTIKNINPIAVSHIVQIGKELVDKIKMTPEEELQVLLGKILQFNQFLTNANVEQDLRNFLDHIYRRFFSKEQLQKSKLLSQLNQQFFNEFINAETKENDNLKIFEKLKNFKDFIQKKLSLTVMQTNLEEISPYLANFNEKGVEIPSQYMVSDQEPLPEHCIFINKFEPMIYRSGINSKKIAIKGSNQKIYAFNMSSMSYSQDYQKFCSEEKVLQLKMIMNQIFSRNKETLRRGAKFYTPIKFVIQTIKLSQDDLPFANLQEIHDYLLQERGLDSDIGMNIQIRKVKEFFEQNPDKPKQLSSINLERARRLNQETYDEMRTIHCQPYLLSSFFHRIFYNVDDLFIFKKQFTTYHAVNSFFCYFFNQSDQFTLGSISFCKTSGRLNFADSKLTDYQKKIVNILIQLNNTNQTISFSQIENQEFQQISSVPFRLTNNIVDFIGKFGLHGLFAGVITSCSLALTKNQDKFQQLLHLIVKDENMVEQKDEFSLFVDYLLYKVRMLSANNRIHTYEDSRQQHMQEDGEEERKDEYVMIGNFKVNKEYLKFEIDKPKMFEEFNKKIFDLIDISMDPNRLSQMPSNWNSWF